MIRDYWWLSEKSDILYIRDCLKYSAMKQVMILFKANLF